MKIPSLTEVTPLASATTAVTAATSGTVSTLQGTAVTEASLAGAATLAGAASLTDRLIPVHIDIPIPVRPHGIPLRGLFAPAANLNDGLFAQMFHLSAAKFGGSDKEATDNLAKLGAAMSAQPDAPFDGPDPEESGIPAAYTYLGQFIDHDLTFDPASSLEKQIDVNALVDFRTPRFDMDNVYGRGPSDQPYMYQADGVHLQLGSDLVGASKNPKAKDLPRSQYAPNRALLGDPRNDENIIVSQLQGLWLRFHNLVADAPANKGKAFEAIQQEVRFHYQWIVLHDFLPKVINAAVLDAVLPGTSAGAPDWSKLNIRFYKPVKDLYMPVEFSGAAYRFGHSLVRPGYRLNDSTGPLPIFAADNGPLDMRGFRPMPSTWALDWRRFIDLEPMHYGSVPPNATTIDPNNTSRLQLAYKMDTSLVNPLALLPHSVAPDAPPASLAARNLLRGLRLNLPSGQQVAKAMGFTPLADADIKIGQFTGDPADIKGTITDPKVGGPIFAGNCPLWTYVLAETIEIPMQVTTLDGVKTIPTRQLGKVGGTIVAETFLGILHGDKSSYVNVTPGWKPSVGVGAGGKFGLRELIGFVTSH